MTIAKLYTTKTPLAAADLANDRDLLDACGSDRRSEQFAVVTFRRFRGLALITMSPARRIVLAADGQLVGHSVACDVVGRRQCPAAVNSDVSLAYLRCSAADWGVYECRT